MMRRPCFSSTVSSSTILSKLKAAYDGTISLLCEPEVGNETPMPVPKDAEATGMEEKEMAPTARASAGMRVYFFMMITPDSVVLNLVSLVLLYHDML